MAIFHAGLSSGCFSTSAFVLACSAALAGLTLSHCHNGQIEKETMATRARIAPNFIICEFTSTPPKVGNTTRTNPHDRRHLALAWTVSGAAGVSGGESQQHQRPPARRRRPAWPPAKDGAGSRAAAGR